MSAAPRLTLVTPQDGAPPAKPKPKKSRRPAPVSWTFNDADRDRFEHRFWRAPRRLLGTWRDLWQPNVSGGGCATSILPVLAVHNFPEQRGAECGWTAWAFLSRRRIGTLCDINKDSVGAAMRLLEREGLIQMQRGARAAHEGGRVMRYRLRASLYASKGEEYAEVRGNLFYGGAWALLPGPAARHLFTVISMLDPIGDERAYLEKVKGEDGTGEPWWNCDYDDTWHELYHESDVTRLVQLQFLGESRPHRSVGELTAAAGLSRRATIDALRVLRAPMFGNRARGDAEAKRDGKGRYRPIGLVASGTNDTGRWFACDRDAMTWRFTPASLNDAKQVAQLRARTWPWLASDHPKKSGGKRRQRRVR